MKLSDIGEFGFIKKIAPSFNDLLDGEITGIGDDCAVIPQSAKSSLLVTTDMLIEDIHFTRTGTGPFELGYKSLAVNLSDIAAMGGKPIASFISIGIPKDTDFDYLDEFYKGYKSLSEKVGVPLLGGDTTKSPDKLVVNVAVIGQAENDKIKYRNGAKVGDIICVTDCLGDSAAGLKLILDNLDSNDFLIKRHNLPEPQINEGMFLSSFKDVHSMMDISDGIGSDLRHILESSNCGAVIDKNSLPLSDQLLAVCKVRKWDAVELAMYGGEDYSLLLTVSKDSVDDLGIRFWKEFKKPLYKIGILTDEKNMLYLKDGIFLEESKSGFNHFSASE